jgi:hypothetical protein
MPDWILNSKFLTILALVICLASVIAFVLGFITQGIMLTILGFVGFPGVAALRDWIDSQGFKTYVIVGLGLVGSIAMALGLIDINVFIAILTLLGIGAAGTLRSAVKKVPAGMPKLKAMSFKKAA